MSSTSHAAGNPGSPYRVPPEPNRWPATGLAVGVHALLLAFLAVGVSWQNNTPVAVEAEVWDVTTQMAAPKAPPPPPPEPEPEVRPQPTPKVAPPPPVEEPLPKAQQPDIALEREKKRKEELKQRKEEERIERERERERELAQKREDEKKAKLLAEKKEREDAEKKKQELAKKEDADKKKLAEKEKAEKVAKEKAEKKAEEAKLAKLHDAEVKRMLAAAGAGSATSTGTAEKSTAPRIDKGYMAKIAAKVKSNSRYAGDTDVPGNPMVTFQVKQLPTGEIISVKIMKSSGIPAFDEAVERAIHLSSPLDKKKDGTVEPTFTVDFKLKEMTQ